MADACVMCVSYIHHGFVMTVQKFEPDDYRNVRFLVGPKWVSRIHDITPVVY